MAERFIRRPEVLTKLGGISEATLREIEESDLTFPRGRSLPGVRVAVYLESDIDAWMRLRPPLQIPPRKKSKKSDE